MLGGPLAQLYELVNLLLTTGNTPREDPVLLRIGVEQDDYTEPGLGNQEFWPQG